MQTGICWLKVNLVKCVFYKWFNINTRSVVRAIMRKILRNVRVLMLVC